MTTPTRTSTLADLAASVAATRPRLVVLSAPAGYGKAAFVRAYAGRYVGPLALCDLPANGDLARPLLDALVAVDSRRLGQSAADRLAQRSEAANANAREALRREWPSEESSRAFAIRDVFAALATPAGADLFGELVETLPPQRVLMVSTRVPLPRALQDIIRGETSKTIGIEDLRLSIEATLNLARAEGLTEAGGAAVYGLARGWPLLTRLLVRLAGKDAVDDLKEAARALTAGNLLGFAAHRTVARLDDPVRKALVVTMLLRAATHTQLVRILGDDCDDLVFSRLTNLPFVVLAGASAIVHPEIAAVVYERFSSLVAMLRERTLNALTGEGAYVEAAHVALDLGDVTRAAAIIDAAPPYTAAPVPLAEYERIIERLDRTLLTRFPNVWIATIPFRSFAVDRATFVREAETVYFCLPAGASPDQRSAALMLLASAYFNANRRLEGERLIDEALRGFAQEPTPARASLLHFWASCHGMEGHFTVARRLAAEAAQITRDPFGETQALHYIEAHEAGYRGQNERVIVIFDELLRRSDALPLHRANTAANGAMFTWVNGDDERFAYYVGVLEDALTPGLERGFRPIVDGARGRAIGTPDGYDWGIAQAQAQLFSLGGALSSEGALDAARAAARCADERGDPYVQLLAHSALYVLDPDAQPREASILRAVVAPVESDEMQEAVAALLRGQPAGILESFLARRVRREHVAVFAPKLVVELLSGRALRDGSPIPLSDKEFELLALLGSAHTPLSRDRIGESLWDHLDPEEWSNNLKVTLSRLRRKLGSRDAILLVDGRYRLSPSIEVDLRHAESTARESVGVRIDGSRRTQLAAIVAAFASSAFGRYDRSTWIQSLRARIEDLVCRAGVLLAEDALARGRPDDALLFATGVAEIDPFNEAACETTIRALLTRGEIDSARREFRRYSASLADELGAPPPARLLELVRQAE